MPDEKAKERDAAGRVVFFFDRHLLHFIALISGLVTIYYLQWRVTKTFNPDALFFSWTLYAAEVFGALTTFLFYFSTWNQRSRQAPPALPGRDVDVFIPTKSESISLLRTTLLACSALKYPHRTLVLDDGNRPEVRALCEEMKCVYLARISHEDAKAGNLNFGLEHSTAEFIAIFDADHVPLSHFIETLIGYFEDEKVGFVQTPQEFYNIDSFQHRTDMKKKTIWGEQYLFFSAIQPGRDYWNAAYFVGSCAMLRRKALDSIKGFSTGSITEDMLTSIRLHAKGWSSIYHNENLAYGIAAETLKPFHVQRQRWGVGNWQVFVRANPLLIKGLTIPQRLSYLSSMIYPLEGFQKLIFYLAPPIALFTGVLPVKALNISYLAHFIPYFALSIFSFNEMAKGFGGQMMLEQFSMGKFFTYLQTLFIPFFPKKSKEFQVTTKGKEGSTPIALIIPQFTVLAFSMAAIAWALFQLLFDERSDNFVVAVNCFWALYNSGLAMAIIHYDYKKLFQRRSAFRVPDAIPAFFRTPDGQRGLAVANNLTEGGLSLFTIGQMQAGQELEIELLLEPGTVPLKGLAVSVRSAAIPGHAGTISRIGVTFNGSSAEMKNFLSGYIHDTAVPKFMKEYSKNYMTFIERKFRAKRPFSERPDRYLSYLPTNISANGVMAVGVIKNVSKNGMLLATRSPVAPGSEISVEVVLGEQRIPLDGLVIRDVMNTNEKTPEHLLGIKFQDPSFEKVPYLLSIADAMGEFIS